MSERSEAKRDGARLQNNSGRGQFAKGDAIWYNFVVDYKEASKSFTLNRNVWGKICTDALKVDIDKHPVLKIILGGKTRLAVVEWSVLQELVEHYERSD